MPPYPLKHLGFANQVAIVGKDEGWLPDYVRATYRRWFLNGQEAGSEPNLSDSLREIGQEPERVLEMAGSDQAKAALDAETDAARSFGIFGAPTFSTGGEIFWGDDRLDDAIQWHRRQTQASTAV